MITLPNGKICMNEQEAIQWLLDNYPIPFQCSANYVGGAEIGLGTIVNPTPAKVKVGSIIFFADSKVSTVVAVNSNSFVCSEQYNDLVDDVVYVSNVQLNASGHLIVTLSNNTNIDAGLIKQVSGFSINASQHLIASYNDGTSTDLGAIFSGNITVSGNLTVTGGVSGNAITGDSIIENMSGYSFNKSTSSATTTYDYIYAGIVKNGNKLTAVLALNVTKISNAEANIGTFNMPYAVAQKLIPTEIGGLTPFLARGTISVFQEDGVQRNVDYYVFKNSSTSFYIAIYTNNLDVGKKTYVRFEFTFLLSDNLAA